MYDVRDMKDITPSEYFIDHRITPKVGRKGMGVFARYPISKNEIIEYSPISGCFREPWNNTPESLKHIVFSFPNNSDTYVIGLGYLSLYNHDDNNNSVWTTTDDGLYITAIRDIESGEELCVNYGDAYWSGGWPKL